MSAIFYVYEHWRPDTNQCFYVGKGKNSRGNYVGSKRYDTHKAVIAHLSSVGLCVEVKVFAGALTEDEAFHIERMRIEYYLSIGVELVNIYWTPEYSKILYAAALRGPKHPCYGKPISAEHKEKIRKFNTGRKHPPRSAEARMRQSIGQTVRYQRAEEREKVAASHRGRKHTPEHRAKVGKASAERVRTPESKEKCRQSHLLFWEKKRAAEAAAKNMVESGDSNVSEISKDLQDQLRGGFDPLLRRFLEKKPGYDGPTLTDSDEAKIKDQELAEARMEAIEARLRFEEKTR